MMALNYDFDMISPMAKAIPGDHDGGSFPGGTAVALFRDPDTVEALMRAPEAVQDYLRASRFGINTYHSGAPAGRYPAADDAARIEVIEALAENVRKFDLPRADDSQPARGAFHLPSFFAAVAEAEPIAMPAPVAAAALPEDLPVIAEAEPALCAAQEVLPEVASYVEEASFGAEPLLCAADDIPPEAAPAHEAALPVEEAFAPASEDPLPEAGDFIAQMMLAEAETLADKTEAGAEAARAPVLLLQNRVYDAQAPEATDDLIAGMMAGDADAADTCDALPADIVVLSVTGPAPEQNPEAEDQGPAAAAVARRGFRLPSLPRWMTATAAFVMLGVAVGTAMI